MPANQGARNRRAGRKRERDVWDHLVSEGWVCAWGRGPFDILASRLGHTWIVEVKSTRLPFSTFGPGRRTELLRLAVKAGAVPVLIHWPFDGKGKKGMRTYFGPAEWPKGDAL